MRKYYIIIFLFLLIGIFITFPLILNLNKSIYSLGGDSFSLVYYLHWIKTNPAHLTFPDNFLFMGLAKLLTIFLDEVIVYNIFIFLSFILTGSAGFLLAKKITNNNIVGLFAGIILCLLPFRITQGMQHLNFADLSGLLFFIYFLLCAKENPNFKNVFFASLFFTITTLWNSQYGFFAGIILLVFIVNFVFEKIISGKFKTKFNLNKTMVILFSIVFSISIISIFNLQIFKDLIANRKNEKVEIAPVRSIDELQSYSSQWFYYLYPSPDNPIFGKWTAPKYNLAVQNLGTNRVEQVLYLGWIPLLLALYAIVQTINLKKQKTKNNVWFFVLMGVTGLILSFSKIWNIFGHDIKSPAQYLFSYLPFFRVYARFGLLVAISTTVLACIGLNSLLTKIKNIKIKYFIFGAILLMTIGELLVWPKDKLIRVDYQAMPQAYKYLTKEPKGILAEYPLLPQEEPNSYDYLLWQRYHQMPLVYKEIVDEKGDDFRKTILDPSSDETINKLKNIGVLYLIVHKDKYDTADASKYLFEYNFGETPQINSDKLEFLGNFHNNNLYKIK